MSHGSDTSGGPAVRAGAGEFMDTSKHRPPSECGAAAGLIGTAVQSGGSGLMGTSARVGRHGLRKASRSVSGGTSGLPMLSQSGLRVPSGLMGTSPTGFWAGSSRSCSILNGSLLITNGLLDLGGCSWSVSNVVLVEMVWSLKDNTPGGGACTMVVEEVEQSWAEARPSPTMVPSLSEGGAM